ncbi:MAG TPA: Na/Pi symporter [Planctomycetota bacterium]|nr:Na/Pi symporter [Planctomycetota bacterium]
MVTAILGGVGLFLLGMALLTDGLKAAAADSLRRALARFTGGPVQALLSGAVVTALAQSSSATTAATIGFVSAGLLTFPQALGVVYGANVGTTSTGWLVALLGLDLSIGALAMPLVAAGALARTLLRGRGASVGLALAGFGLLFIGIDALQAGMKGLAEKVSPAAFPGDTPAGRLLLVGIGVAMTVVIQSSSAAVAMTLTALHAGTIALDQAAALVIGQNVGTTATAVIASIGGSVSAKRTALAHVAFNCLTGVVAFALLPLFVRAASAVAARIGGEPGATSLAAFHTGFNLLGVALFLPFTGRFAALIAWLVRERGPALTRNLDPSTAAFPAVAVEVARRTAVEIAAVVVGALRRLLRGEGSPAEAGEDLAAAAQALAATRRYLATVRSGRDQLAAHARHLSTLHAIDHVDRLVEACAEEGPRRALARDGLPGRAAAALSEELDFALVWLAGGAPGAPVDRAGELSRSIAEMRRAHRPELLARTAAGEIDPDAAERQLEAMRWVDRLAYHTWRAAHHLADPDPARAAVAPHEDVGAGAPR